MEDDMRVAIGSDHAGYSVKEKIKKYLDKENIPYTDFGTVSSEPVDYPDIAVKVAKAVSEQKVNYGVLVCSTGIGMSVVANKIPGVRAALCRTVESAKLSRQHNNANVLTLAGRQDIPKSIEKIVKTFLETGFERGGRHESRVNKIHQLTGL